MSNARAVGSAQHAHFLRVARCEYVASLGCAATLLTVTIAVVQGLVYSWGVWGGAPPPIDLSLSILEVR